MLHGVEDRETYIHRINVAELWSAFTVRLPGEAVPRIGVTIR